MRIGWFDRWFMRMSRRAWEMGQLDQGKSQKTRDLHLHFGPQTMNLLVHRSSNGGYAVEFVKYDVNVDKTTRDLYVFEDDGALGDKLSQVIVMHSLRNS